MTDMTAVTAPKSDQINADDLISGPRTIRIKNVVVNPGTEQPVSVHFDGGEGRPFKPCKSMCRIMVNAWGPDAKNYSGRSLTLYRDPSVKWGGMEVGGIRISHMSHIDKTMVMALTASKGNRKPHRVDVLRSEPQATQPAAPQISAELEQLASEAASKGVEEYQRFFTELTAAEKRFLVDSGAHARLKTDAQNAGGDA